MKVLLCLFTPLACVFLHSCVPTIQTLEQRYASEVKPLTSTPEKLLIGGWVQRGLTGKHYVGYSPDGIIYAGAGNALHVIGQWSYNSKTGYLSGKGPEMTGKSMVRIKFLNDNLLLIGTQNPMACDRVSFRKLSAKPKKSSSTSRGMSNNVRRYYDWLLRREFGDPGPVPKVSNYDRKKAVNMFVIQTGALPSREINYGR